MVELRPKSIDSLTSLRGVLALWVVFYHYWNDVLALFPSTDLFTPLVRQGHFAVPVFFTLSGVVLAHNYSRELSRFDIRQYGQFVFLRLARIYPVHLFTLLVVLGMVIVCRVKGWSITDTGYGDVDFVLNLFLVQTWVPNFRLNWNYPSWSISSEWFAYLCFPLICATVLRRITTGPQAYLFLVLTWAASVGLYTFGDDLLFRELIKVIPTFLAGMAIFACLSNSPRQLRTPLRIIPDIQLFGLAIVPCVINGPFMVVLLVTGFLALVYMLVYLENDCSRLWTNGLVIYLGDVSYSLYMAHTLAQKVCYKLLPVAQYIDAIAIARFCIIFVYIVLVTVFTLGTYYLIERPSRRRLRKLFRAPGEPTDTLCVTGCLEQTNGPGGSLEGAGQQEVTVQPTSEKGHLWPTAELSSGHLRTPVDKNTALLGRLAVQLRPFSEVG